MDYILDSSGHRIGSIDYDRARKKYVVYNEAGRILGSAYDSGGTFTASGYRISMDCVPALLFQKE